MRFKRFPLKDPRTVARDIPGVLDSVFPQINPSLVAYLNKSTRSVKGVIPIEDSILRECSISRPILFEISNVFAENVLSGNLSPSWEHCIEVAVARQSRHYDTRVPDSIVERDIEIAEAAASNLIKTMQIIRDVVGNEIAVSPKIPGYTWIASGHGDFSIGSALVEVKFTNRNFSSGDFRQVLMYWLLSYLSSIEKNNIE